MSWSFGTITLITTDDETDQEIYRAKLKVLDGTADVLQFFGAGSVHHKIKALVITDADLTQLRTWATADTPQTLTGSQGSLGSFKIDGSVKAARLKYSGASLKGTTYTTDVTPIYEVEIDFVSTAAP